MAGAGAIENPVTGERLVVLETGRDTGGELFAAEYFLRAGGSVEAHLHPRQEEVHEVISGRARFRIAGSERIAARGDRLVTPPGVPHALWNIGDDEAHFRVEYRPALPDPERFFETFYGLARDGKTNAKGMPGLLQLAVMAREYGDFVRAASPRWPVQRALFAILAPLGRLRGYRASYPEYSR